MGSMQLVTPSRARPASNKPVVWPNATVSHPIATPADERATKGLRPIRSLQAPQNPTNKKVKSWSMDVHKP